VAEVESEEPVLKTFFGEPIGEVVSDFVKAAAAGRDAKFVERLEHERDSIRVF